MDTNCFYGQCRPCAILFLHSFLNAIGVIICVANNQNNYYYQGCGLLN
jgi:hypothetical protein